MKIKNLTEALNRKYGTGGILNEGNFTVYGYDVETGKALDPIESFEKSGDAFEFFNTYPGPACDVYTPEEGYYDFVNGGVGNFGKIIYKKDGNTVTDSKLKEWRLRYKEASQIEDPEDRYLALDSLLDEMREAYPQTDKFNKLWDMIDNKHYYSYKQIQKATKNTNDYNKQVKAFYFNGEKLVKVNVKSEDWSEITEELLDEFNGEIKAIYFGEDGDNGVVLLNNGTKAYFGYRYNEGIFVMRDPESVEEFEALIGKKI